MVRDTYHVKFFNKHYEPFISVTTLNVQGYLKSGIYKGFTLSLVSKLTIFIKACVVRSTKNVGFGNKCNLLISFYYHESEQFWTITRWTDKIILSIASYFQ